MLLILRTVHRAVLQKAVFSVKMLETNRWEIVAEHLIQIALATRRILFAQIFTRSLHTKFSAALLNKLLVEMFKHTL